MNKPIFYDCDCLSYFLIADSGYILEKLFSKIIIPEQVYNELSCKSTPQIIRDNYNKLSDNFVEIYKFDIPSQEYINFKSIRDGNWSKSDYNTLCGDGESAVIALADLNNGIIASNNLRDVAEYVKDENLNIAGLITSSIILSTAFEKKIVCRDKANEIYKKMIDGGGRLPCKSFDEYYDKLYEKDCKEFLSNGF